MPKPEIDYDKIIAERRFKVLHVTEEEIIDCVCEPCRHMRLKALNIPDNCWIKSVFYDYQSQMFGFIIGCMDFEPADPTRYLPAYDIGQKYKMYSLAED